MSWCLFQINYLSLPAPQRENGHGCGDCLVLLESVVKFHSGKSQVCQGYGEHNTSLK